jgi:7-carboxy-7-deazaguanine synthase
MKQIMRGAGRSPKVSPSLRIAETFVSRQGEGRLTGTMSFFIRTSGCNLRCWFCDTPYASWQPEGAQQPIDQLVEQAVASGCGHVVLTGGEPLLPVGVVELVERLRAESLHVTIETAGTVDRELTADLISISPKLAGSGPGAGGEAAGTAAIDPAWTQRHEATRWRPEVVRQLIDRSVAHQLKFVVDRPEDFAAAVEAAAEIGTSPEAVWIMPQGTTAATLDATAVWLEPLCAASGFQYCDRLHVRWYGNRRGT